MPKLPKQPKPQLATVIRAACDAEHRAARRLLVAGPGSVVGRYPLGNTGGANVSAVAPMDIPEDLRAILDGAPITA